MDDFPLQSLQTAVPQQTLQDLLFFHVFPKWFFWCGLYWYSTFFWGGLKSEHDTLLDLWNSKYSKKGYWTWFVIWKGPPSTMVSTGWTFLCSFFPGPHERTMFPKSQAWKHFRDSKFAGGESYEISRSGWILHLAINRIIPAVDLADSKDDAMLCRSGPVRMWNSEPK